MGSHVPVELSGVALADSTLSCPTDSGDTYGEIVCISYNDAWYDGLVDIVLDPESSLLYGSYEDGHFSKLSPDLEGISAYYNEDTLVLYIVDVPNFYGVFVVAASPLLTYENTILTGPQNITVNTIVPREDTTDMVDEVFSGNHSISLVYVPSSVTVISPLRSNGIT